LVIFNPETLTVNAEPSLIEPAAPVTVYDGGRNVVVGHNPLTL
jgi:hypothetical protein